MTSPASSSLRRRRPSRTAVASLAVAAVLGATSVEAGAPAAPAEAAVTPSPVAARVANPFAGHFPNVVLRTHEGRNVRFYDDLLKGKIVLINFMYATCTER